MMDEFLVQSDCFPKLTAVNHHKTSSEDEDYNCIAWAAEDVNNKWWPNRPGRAYWPPGVCQEETLACFIEAFQTLQYEPCENGELEPGWQKIVIYADAAKVPQHMARQCRDGRWTSKIGDYIDIKHELVEDVEGPLYGMAVQYMRRPSKDQN